MNKINPITYFTNPADGRPVSGGKLYIGNPDTDPAVLVNQKQVYALQEDGNTVAISQPVSLSVGGTPVYNGGNVSIYVTGDYSIKVLTATNSQVLYIPDSSVVASSEQVVYYNTVAEMIASSLTVGALYKTKGYYASGDGGGASYLITAGNTGDGYVHHNVGINTAVLVASGSITSLQAGVVMDGSDNTAAIQAAIDSGFSELVITPGTSAINQLTIGLNDFSLVLVKGATLLPQTWNQSAILITADYCRISGGGVIQSPATFDGTNVTPTYAVLWVTGEDFDVADIVIRNVPKVGIRFEDVTTGSVRSCRIEGGTENAFFTGTNTSHWGISINPPGTGSQGRFIISNNFIEKCVQGGGSSNVGAASNEQGIVINGNSFENCWNHGWYSAGFANGVALSGNSFVDCQVPIALTGKNHSITGNTLLSMATGAGGTTDNEVTGISMRDPFNCVISGNTIKGDANTVGGVIISLQALVTDVDVGNNIVSNNIIIMSGVGIANAIRLLGSGKVYNNVVNGNVIVGYAKTNTGLIELSAGAGLESYGNVVSGNTIQQKGPSASQYGIYLLNIKDSTVSNNNITLEFDAGSAITVAGITFFQCSSLQIIGNSIKVPAAYGTNITYRGIYELTSGSGNRVAHNYTNLSTAKLSAAVTVTGVSGSGIFIDHIGTGSPENVYIAGPGSVFHRTDGGATTSIYIKETGTSNTGWIGK